MPTCKKCGEVVGALEITEGLCKKCATPENLEKIRELNKDELKKLAGIKGWLILVAISLALNLLIGLVVLIEGLNFNNTPIIIFSSILIGFLVYLNYIFYTKKRTFPKVFILYNTIGIVFAFIKVIMVAIKYNNFNLPYLLISILINSVWISYMKNSKRVKATFVN